MDGSLLAPWAATAEAIASTSKRREKGAILARYLAGLDAASLAVAARFFAGVVFPRHDARTTQAGPALVFAALAGVAGVDPASLGERYVAHGDAGDLAAELLAGRRDAGLSLLETADRLAALSAAPGTAQRRAALEALLGTLGAREARYLVRLLLGELRIGLKEAQVEEAVAAAFARPLDAVRRAHLLRGDLGEVAQLARAGRLDGARLALFHPLGFMLAQPLAAAEDVVARLPAPFVVEHKYDGIRAQAHVAGGAWFKLKQPLATLDVVVTAVERGHGRRRAVLSDYTFAVRAAENDPRLLVVGKAYSGLTDVEIAALTERFEALTLERRGGWHRVRPEVVIEVAFDVVQPSGRHASGYALRFPRIVRVRDDKPVAEIDTLARVRALAGAP